MGLRHINSYYAATVDAGPPRPELQGEISVDVAVVGGGFSGIATALTLAERGYSVAVVEAHRVGWGASGRNGGQVIAGISGEGAIEKQWGERGRALVASIRYRGHDIIAERIERFGIACDFKRGWMEVSTRPSHQRRTVEHYESLVAAGEAQSFELVDKQEVARLLGTLAYHGGLIDMRSGHLHPLKLVLGEARAAESLGVRIFENSAAVRLEGGERPFVETDKGRIQARSIVVGGSTDHPFHRGRLKGVVLPTGSYIIATEPLSDALAAEINARDLAVCDSNVVLDYYRLTADKRMLFGGRCNYSNRDPADIAAAMRPRMVELFPQLSDTRIAFAWGGRIDIVLNRAPLIGRLEPNVYYLEGYCGHGVNTTHIAAEIVSDAIQGTFERFDVFDKLQHYRLPVGQWLGNQALALGMLYYRVKDLV